MRNKLALSIALVASLQASLVSALSLGDLTVESKVNEPLNAVIELTGASHLSASQILVQMAGPEDFRRANVERPFFLTSISFNVEQNRSGQPVLRLTSAEKITEPYINFILETRWPNGRVMREYLALLDLPIHSSAQGRGVDVATQSNTQPANTVTRSSSQPANQPAVSSRPSATRTNSAAAQGGFAGGADSYTVQSNDTAWEIAEQFTPSGARVEQTLYALYNQNTDAFANGDVNRLNNGAVLRVPSAEDVAAISAAQAKNWQREQHSNWKARTATAKTSQALDGARKTRQTSSPSKDSNGHLTLTSQSGVEQHLSQAEKTLQEATQNGSGAAADGQLVAALEKLDRTQLEKNALDERYASLQQRFAQLEKLVTLKNAQLAELTASVEKSDQILTELEKNSEATGASSDDIAESSAVDSAATASDATESGAAATVDTLSADTGATDVSVAGVDAELAADLTQTAADDAAAVEISAVEKTTLSTEAVTAPVNAATDQTLSEVADTPAIVKASGTLETFTAKLSGITSLLPAVIRDNVVAVGGAVSGLLLAIAGFFVVRSRRSGTDDASDLALETPVWGDTDFESEEDLLDSAEAPDLENEEVGFGLPQASIEGEEGLELVEEGVSEVGGLLAEVDIYLSYGRHDQAIESLQQLIAENESNTELHLKLIEVYRAKGDQTQAQETAETLLKFDPAAQPQVNDLLNDVGVATDLAETQAHDSALFNGEEFSGDAIAEAESSDLDLSLDLHDSLDDSDTAASNDDLASLDEDDFSAAFESSDNAGDILDLSEDTIDSGALETDALELDTFELDTFEGSDGELPTADLTSNEFDLSLDELGALGELEPLEADSLDASIDLDTGVDALSSLDGAEAETAVESLDDSLDLEEPSLDLDEVSLELNDLSEEVLTLETDELSIDLDGDLASLEEQSQDSVDAAVSAFDLNDTQEAGDQDSVADEGSLDSEIAAAYGDLDIDLSATQAEADGAPETSFGNPSVEEVLGTDDIPTLEMSDTYVADDELSESLGLQAEGESDAGVSELDIAAITDDDLEAEYQSAAALLEQSADAPSALESGADEAAEATRESESSAEAAAEPVVANADDDDFGDEIATKLDLARAYLEMGDIDGAKDVLDEVASEGDKRQQQEAAALLQKIA